MTIEMVTEELSGPGVWLGPDIQNDRDWIMQLDGDDVAEIDAALAAVKAAGTPIPFPASAFPLQNFTKKIDTLVEAVSRGRGLMLMRGLPRERYSDEDCELIYWGIGVHIGMPVSQNRRGHVLGHVRDEGRDINDPSARPYQTASKMDFHCDLMPVDVLGLFCAHAAKSGGESYVVSAQTVHNLILAEHPEFLEALYQPFNVDWADEEPAGSQPWYTMPMFSANNGTITSRITSRRFIQMVTRHGDHLGASPVQLDAIEFAQQVAQRPELRLSMTLGEGDMQFLSNHTTLHARSAFEDTSEADRQRHLLRMWVALEDAKRRSLSPLLDERYSWVERGGIPQKEAA
ncbi:MAG: TauD/TfdA family dioxygenase [Alphaproteobacteria bacterium]|nr:TauD/TfdA family dioxygenase [Alphaproteobacteria bacterium]